LPSFAVHVHQLTQPHISNGEHQPPLLTRLRNATTPGSDGGRAGGGDTGKPIPIDPTALDLFCKIETAARTEYRHYRSMRSWRFSTRRSPAVSCTARALPAG